MADVKQLRLKLANSDTFSTYDIKDATARAATSNALYYDVQNLTAAQKTQVYENLGLENVALLEYEVVS